MSKNKYYHYNKKGNGSYAKSKYAGYDDGHGYCGVGYKNAGEYNDEGFLKHENRHVFDMKRGAPNAINNCIGMPEKSTKSKRYDKRRNYYEKQVKPKLEAQKPKREPTEYEKATAGMDKWQKAQYNLKIARERKKKEQEEFHRLLHGDDPIPETPEIKYKVPEEGYGYPCITFDAPETGIVPISIHPAPISRLEMELKPFSDVPFFHLGPVPSPFSFKIIDE